jgi:hypothetical protein
MKPFADPSIMSVAGVEENFNKDAEPPPRLPEPDGVLP